MIWETNPENDYFVNSHGIKTPDAYWKVIIRGSGETIAWKIPNSTKATRNNLDRYIIAPIKLQKQIKMPLPEVPSEWLKKRPRVSWQIPPGCDPG